MSNFDQLLPQRNLQFLRNPLQNTLILAPVLLFVLAMGAGLVWWQAPGLLRDWSIRSNPLLVERYDMRGSECNKRKGFFTTCKADVAYQIDGRDYEQHLELMFLSFTRGDYQTGLVVDAADHAKAALTLGLDHFWNRVLLLLVFFAGVVALAAWGIFDGLRSFNANRSAREPQRWVPETVPVTGMQKVLGGNLVIYRFRNDKGGKRKATSRFGRDEVPLMLDVGGETVALALRPVGGGMPLLLDDELQRIDLSTKERQAAIAMLTGTTPHHQSTARVDLVT